MDDRLIGRIDRSVLALGAVLALATLALLGAFAALGAVVGAIVGYANWRTIRFVLSRIRQAPDKAQGYLLLLTAKMGALIALSWLLIARFDVHPVGFAIGMGSLVGGLLIGSLTAPRVSGAQRGATALPEEGNG